MLTGRFGIRATTGQAAIVAAIVSEVSTTGKLHKSGAKSLKIESASQNTGISAFFPHVVHVLFHVGGGCLHFFCQADLRYCCSTVNSPMTCTFSEREESPIPTAFWRKLSRHAAFHSCSVLRVCIYSVVINASTGSPVPVFH